MDSMNAGTSTPSAVPRLCGFGSAARSGRYQPCKAMHSVQDTVAEWLRRRPAKPMGSPRMGSNPIGVAFCQKVWHTANMRFEKSVKGTWMLAFFCDRLIVYFRNNHILTDRHPHEESGRPPNMIGPSKRRGRACTALAQSRCYELSPSVGFARPGKPCM